LANIKAAIKYIRKSRKNRERNLTVKNHIKKLYKDSLKLIAEKSKEASDMVKKTISAIDKAQENGMMHKNTAARKKSRLVLKLNAASK
jgi:small subunit ribosomal protein S20